MWSVSQGAAGKAGDRGPAAEHQLGLGGSGQARPGAGGGAVGGQHLYLGVLFPRLSVHPRPQVREGRGARFADRAVPL